MTVSSSLTTLVIAAGAAQLALVAVSPAIPRALGWREKLSPLDPLMRRLFWVYAGYILATNLAFALVSILLGNELTSGSVLARSLCVFIGLYWSARVLIQFALFHSAAPPGAWFRVAEAALCGLFLFLAAAYLAAAILQ